MSLFMDSFWRALGYCLHPRVMVLLLVPQLLMVGLGSALSYFFWEPAVNAVQQWVGQLALLETFLKWLDAVGGQSLRNVLAPFIVLCLAIPLIIMITLLLVTWILMPPLVTLVAKRRFPTLQAQPGSTLWPSLWLGLSSSVLAILALVISMPLWFIPPLIMILPPLVWGWLTYRVMSFDVLAAHATQAERIEVMQQHRLWLLAIGVLTAYLGSAPALVFTFGAAAVVMAPLMVPLAILLYTLVFVFSALWFAHFCLAALVLVRDQNTPPPSSEPLALQHDTPQHP
jgi:hypothetical protein